MTTVKPNLNNQVLERVRVVYHLRRLSDPIVAKSGGVLALLALTVVQVSLLDVMANAPSLTEPSAAYHFFYDAYLKTEWLMKVVLALALLVGLWLMTDAWRNVRGWRPHWRPQPLRFFRFN